MSGIGSKVSDENDHKEGRDDDQVLVEAEVRGQVALVLLAEAHPAAAAALSHTNVIHHKVVDVEVVRAASTYFGLRCKNCRFFGRVVRCVFPVTEKSVDIVVTGWRHLVWRDFTWAPP